VNQCTYWSSLSAKWSIHHSRITSFLNEVSNCCRSSLTAWLVHGCRQKFAWIPFVNCTQTASKHLCHFNLSWLLKWLIRQTCPQCIFSVDSRAHDLKTQFRFRGYLTFFAPFLPLWQPFSLHIFLTACFCTVFSSVFCLQLIAACFHLGLEDENSGCNRIVLQYTPNRWKRLQSLLLCFHQLSSNNYCFGDL